MTPRRETALGLASGVTVLLVFAGMLVVSRHGATATLTIWDMAGLRFGVGALATAVLLSRLRPVRIGWRRSFALAFFSGAPYALCVFGGFTFAPVAHAGVIVNGAMPMFTALIGWLVFRETVGGWRLGGVALIVAGVALIGWDSLRFGEPGQWQGHVLFLVAALSNAIFLAAVRGWRIGVIEMLAAVMGWNALLYLPLWLLFLPSTLAAAPWSEIVLQGGYQGLVVASASAMLLTFAARTIGATRQAAIMAGAPALALVAAIPLLGEIPTPQAVAGVVVVTAGILVTLGPRLLQTVAEPAA